MTILYYDSTKLLIYRTIYFFGIQCIGILNKFIELTRQYGPVWRVWLGNQLFQILADPKDIEFFLTSYKYLDKSYSYRLLDDWLGTKGLLTSNANPWKHHRKLLVPSFHLKILELSIGMMQRNAKILCEQLSSKVDLEEFNVHEFTEKFSLDVISESTMGINLGIQMSNNDSYLTAVKSLTTCMVKRSFSPWLQSNFIFKCSPLGREFYKSLDIVKKVTIEVIKSRRNILQDEKITQERKKHKAFLDFMLLESNFTDEEIENEVQTMLFAGHDTTTAAIAFGLFMLSKHSDIEENVLQELKTIINEKTDEEFTSQDYAKMKYLEKVIHETLRMFSSVPMISRDVPEDITLPSGYILPAGSMVNFFLQYLHNDPHLFKNPEKFMPERFDNDEIKPFSYIPFSAGPRNCIGQKLAILELKVAISEIILKFKLLPSIKTQKIRLETGIVLRSLDQVPIRLTYRN